MGVRGFLDELSEELFDVVAVTYGSESDSLAKAGCGSGCSNCSACASCNPYLADVGFLFCFPLGSV
jgi:hypothetical protein